MRMMASARVRISRQLSRRQAFCRGSLGRRFFRVQLFRVGIGGISSPKLRLFTLSGRGWVQLLGQVE